MKVYILGFFSKLALTLHVTSSTLNATLCLLPDDMNIVGQVKTGSFHSELPNLA